MQQLTDLKAILHSKRANIYYLDKCRVMQKDGRVLYLTEEQDNKQYWNIPIANTTCILLGGGTSITQAAMRMLAQAGVLVGFSGSGGTPLLMATQIEWLTPQSEYRPTEYVQAWMGFWFNEGKRLHFAKIIQTKRIDFLNKIWGKDKDLQVEGITPNIKLLDDFKQKIINANSVNKLLTDEMLLTKALYRQAVTATKTTKFTRQHDSTDLANDFLNHGNYLAYGLAATTLWVLGIPHGFALMHGKTRRGALVFDIADLIKDTLILPWAFICAKERMSEQEFRQQCLQNFTKHKALDFMFQVIKEICAEADKTTESEKC
ncbi:CRISPR-associated protein Cas1 [uncultured Gammaproteobacteria bacterium]|jgi:CRISPR-associated protein Cas1|uniref:CRISPR-associated endonuclease Cas1 n=2 Tax=sulfur-oxidizing symbionts TaxID=32036 RepID=A0A1H6JGW2_9GAMM|nr:MULTISPECIES: type I-F CRISPR-associated endonuclease Cas1f [sulfur-oxidizing symbionts]CAC5860793.1 CRISPR-associated protein Cas1 [uncultured Gammaproteobacteria bacterium]CAB5498605.1 CRISPR-associated protein Cas1 [Bathymodiolus thermophilus thioautotrophic gill symbiont]CAC9507272.1 CRISPR-associated protein Cas1 [uncultured Gammaproteobacteria bacterium]SEH58178.1 CRISPR-associated endonuclease Cas1 [Bathymodiolus azoricus thioautotrophic gill symbiont]SEH73684.1 CRISPR-associated end